MRKPRLTGWFPANTAPVRDGWYEVQTEDGEQQMAQWAVLGGDRGWWQFRRVFGIDLRRSVRGIRRWRGLARPANG
ncbi:MULTISPECIES: hypothetical protein [Niveibacterium]|uniref:Uncharacterized protein n=1 Tax=Niveibacterium microcysteis TaxID=2811415 RepID=A0ABX7M7V9_9RHOO|nr:MULTISPECIES: hypothetical protein [Niveibacterium]QSI76798.1 hypothetical protein JY500_20480 [Niveibacterium microcysteis]